MYRHHTKSSRIPISTALVECPLLKLEIYILYRGVLIQIDKVWSSAARQVFQRLPIVWGELKWDESVPQTSVNRL